MTDKEIFESLKKFNGSITTLTNDLGLPVNGVRDALRRGIGDVDLVRSAATILLSALEAERNSKLEKVRLTAANILQGAA